MVKVIVLFGILVLIKSFWLRFSYLLLEICMVWFGCIDRIECVFLMDLFVLLVVSWRVCFISYRILSSVLRFFYVSCYVI